MLKSVNLLPAREVVIWDHCTQTDNCGLAVQPTMPAAESDFDPFNHDTARQSARIKMLK